MKLRKIYMFQKSLPVLVAIFGVLTGRINAENPATEEPKWTTEWEQVLVNWVKSLTPADLAVEQKTFDFDKYDDAGFRRNRLFVQGWAPPARIANTALMEPPADYLWKGGIWRPDLAVNQQSLESLGLQKGQIWLPEHPTVACNVAWLYSCREPWNPYAGDCAVAYRAAVIAAINLVMYREQIRYDCSGEPGCQNPPASGPHTGVYGFGLFFNAYMAHVLSSALPPDVNKAFAEGLKWQAELQAKSKFVGPENMMIAAPIGIYYAGLVNDDEELKAKADEVMTKLMNADFKKAGYIRDGWIPDGSYNGISIYLLAQYYGLTHSPRLKQIFESVYRLKKYMTLPEPDGTTLSPSHFNSRTQDGFDRDQYNGREVIFLSDVPDAAYFLKTYWLAQDTADAVRKTAKEYGQRPFNRMPEPAPWGHSRPAEHKWDFFSDLSYVIFHEKDFAAMEKAVAEATVPIATLDRFTENFANEFYVVRRPAYGAIFYAGPSTPFSDDGATNAHQMLSGEGGIFNGFGGGGLSAFWTPEAGSVLIGRLTGKEGYVRQNKFVEAENHSYQIEGWRDWLTNQIVGETQEGKIVSSSRVGLPSSKLSADGNELTIRSVLPRETKKQGTVIDARVSYVRTYHFGDTALEAKLEIQTDKPIALKSFYEALPVRFAPDTTASYLDTAGKPVTEADGVIKDVKTVRLSRAGHETDIAFSNPVSISTDVITAISRQRTLVEGRSMLIVLPTSLSPGQPVTLQYTITPRKSSKTANL